MTLSILTVQQNLYLMRIYTSAVLYSVVFSFLITLIYIGSSKSAKVNKSEERSIQGCNSDINVQVLVNCWHLIRTYISINLRKIGTQSGQKIRFGTQFGSGRSNRNHRFEGKCTAPTPKMNATVFSEKTAFFKKVAK